MAADGELRKNINCRGGEMPFSFILYFKQTRNFSMVLKTVSLLRDQREC